MGVCLAASGSDIISSLGLGVLGFCLARFIGQQEVGREMCLTLDVELDISYGLLRCLTVPDVMLSLSGCQL